MSGHAETPELVKLAGRAMLNDPESVSGELVRAWNALLAENQRLRDFIQAVADCEYYSAALRENACEALAGDTE